MGSLLVLPGSHSLLLHDEPIRLVPPNECSESVLTDAANNKMHNSKETTGMPKNSSWNYRGSNDYLLSLFGGQARKMLKSTYFMDHNVMQCKITESRVQIHTHVKFKCVSAALRPGDKVVVSHEACWLFPPPNDHFGEVQHRRQLAEQNKHLISFVPKNRITLCNTIGVIAFNTRLLNYSRHKHIDRWTRLLDSDQAVECRRVK